MSFLDEYKRLAESETDNEFPEQMEHDGLSESDRDMYEEVLNKMRSDMEKANEDMRRNAGSWGDVCEEVNGTIQNKTYKRQQLNTDAIDDLKSVNQRQSTNGAYSVSEPFGLAVDGFRCPKCGKLMYEDGNKLVCPVCGYNEESNGRNMRFYFVDNTYTKTALRQDDNYHLCEIFKRANKK